MRPSVYHVSNIMPQHQLKCIATYIDGLQLLCHMAPITMSLAIVQYIPRNMHTAFALLCFVVVIHWLIFPYPTGLLHWHCGNLTIAPVPAKQPWWIWINTSCEFIMNDCITTTKQSTTKPCAYFLGYTVHATRWDICEFHLKPLARYFDTSHGHCLHQLGYCYPAGDCFVLEVSGKGRQNNQ